MQMKFLNIGPLELIFIILIALLVLGPNETLKAIRTVGQWIYKLVRSPYWQTVLDAQKEIRDLPTKLVRESGLKESLAEIRKETVGMSTDLKRDIDKARAAMKVDDLSAAATLVTDDSHNTIASTNNLPESQSDDHPSESDTPKKE